MRSLVQPAVLRASALAAALSALACWPRLALWTERTDAIGFLLAVVAACAFFLWNFVFGWHERYTQRPVFAPVEPKLWSLVTVLALVVAIVVRIAGDPFVRPLAPDEFPNDLATWAAMLLFGVGLGSVFLVFAPFALFVRLTRRGWCGFICGAVPALCGGGALWCRRGIWSKSSRRIARRVERLLVAVGDARLAEVVRGHLRVDLVADRNADEVLAHLPGDMRENLVTVFKRHAEHRSRQYLGYCAG